MIDAREVMQHKKKYLIIVAITSFLVIVNQIIIQDALAQKRNDAKNINISGKQRMLSQRLVNLAFEYETSKEENKKTQLLNTVDEWKNVHYALQNGNKNLAIKKVDEAVGKELLSLNNKVEFAEQFTKNIESKSKNDFSVLIENQYQFLGKMDDIVKSLEKISDKKLNNIILIEVILAIITLLIIYSEVLLVIRPIINDLTRKNENLDQKNKILEEYAYIASHDLRTPIVNILSFTSLIKKKQYQNLDEDGKLYFDFIKDSADRMDETTKDLLKFSLLDKIEIKEVEPQKIIEKAIESKRLILETKKGNIELGTMPNKIHVDEKQFYDIMGNLIDNAIKFVPNEKQPAIKINCIESKKHYQFQIMDNGIGIATEYQKKVFSIFQRLHNHKKYKGTGIGLALVKKIVEQHKGNIWIDSELGKGTTINFTIPKMNK